jgi:hypothetical protein
MKCGAYFIGAEHIPSERFLSASLRAGSRRITFLNRLKALSSLRSQPVESFKVVRLK